VGAGSRFTGVLRASYKSGCKDKMPGDKVKPIGEYPDPRMRSLRKSITKPWEPSDRQDLPPLRPLGIFGCKASTWVAF
jgi:hypothetical protein